jgi:hypothetical protein
MRIAYNVRCPVTGRWLAAFSYPSDIGQVPFGTPLPDLIPIWVSDKAQALPYPSPEAAEWAAREAFAIHDRINQRATDALLAGIMSMFLEG